MKYLSPAVFTGNDTTGYTVKFPDLPNCYTQGDNLQDAFEMAMDALSLVLFNMEESNSTIPTHSTFAPCKNDEFVSYILADTLEYRKLNDSKAVKKTLTIPNWLNSMAEREGVNFSQVLQAALKQLLNVDKH